MRELSFSLSSSQSTSMSSAMLRFTGIGPGDGWLFGCRQGGRLHEDLAVDLLSINVALIMPVQLQT
jgi:hypothetical protein